MVVLSILIKLSYYVNKELQIHLDYLKMIGVLMCNVYRVHLLIQVYMLLYQKQVIKLWVQSYLMEVQFKKHLSHGFYLPNKNVHWTSELYNFQHYELGENNLIDYDQLEEKALEFKPKLIIAGFSAYTDNYDYKRMRDICDKIGAILMSDMAHISGLVAAGIGSNPFEYSHVVTTTTHKTLRGPRGALVFALKNYNDRNLISEINEKVFPGIQGGPHNHTIAGIANCLLDAQTKEFKQYQEQVVQNAQMFAQQLQNQGFEVVTGGTKNHMVLVNLKNLGIDGGATEYLLQNVNISLNKNTVKGDKSALRPNGLRLGTPSMTTRGCQEKEFEQIAEFLKRGVEIAKKYNTFKKLSNFKKKINEVKDSDEEIIQLKNDVINFSKELEFPYQYDLE